MSGLTNIAVAMACLPTLVSPALSQSTAPPRQHQSAQTYMLKGECSRLVVRDEALKDCIGGLMNTVWPDSRSGFYFVAQDGLAVTFTGMGSSQVHPTPNKAVQIIDGIIMTRPPSMPERIKAVGMCRFENPATGLPVPITCMADTNRGRFEAEFRSDGAPPLVANLPAPSMDEVKKLLESVKK